IVADFDQRLEAVQAQGKRGKAIYMTPTGVTSGPGTLIHEMLLAAGFDNYATRPGWQAIPLERFAYEQPDAIAGAFFDEDAQRPAQWSATRHPVAKRQMADRPTARLQGAWTSCGGWFLMDAIETIAALPQAEASE
ncbi:MAG: ABC transporter substrate-binding protein, partial [Pseudomonadota bacterium]